LKSVTNNACRSCSKVLNLRGTTMNSQTLERFVDADEAAKFLSLRRRRLLDLVRARKLPGHPTGDGLRRVWRFRLSEISAAITSPQKSGFNFQERTHMVRTQIISRDCESHEGKDSSRDERGASKGTKVLNSPPHLSWPTRFGSNLRGVQHQTFGCHVNAWQPSYIRCRKRPSNQ